MIPEKEITRISKFLSLVLRHQPEVLGIELDRNGWTSVDLLLQKMKQQFALDKELLVSIVVNNNKQRFAFNEDQSLIRASQGHSVAVDLAYAPLVPPAVLYHGTSTRFRSSILSSGLEKRSRQHVHLSADTNTALLVGRRHGSPVILEIDAANMHRDGFLFYRSENGVWLTDRVPVAYLREKNLAH